MADYQAAELLKQALRKLMRRLNLLRMEFCLTRVFAVGLLVAVAVLGLHKTFLITTGKWLPLIVVIVTGLIGLEWWRRKRANLFEAAIEADRALRLKEKLSSGMALSSPELVRRKARRSYSLPVEGARHPAARWMRRAGARVLQVVAWLLPPVDVTPGWARREMQSELVPALVQDAAEHANQARPRQVFPWRADWRLYSLGAIEIFALLALVFWQGKDLRPAEKRAVGKALEVEGKKLEEVARHTKEMAEREKMSEAKKAALELQKLGKQMQEKRMPKRDAMLKLDQLGKDFEKLQDRAAQKEEAREVTSLQKLAEAMKEEQLQNEQSQELARQLAQQSMADAQRALDDIKKQMENEKTSAEQKKQMAKDLEQMAKALDKAGSKELAKKMQEMAQSIKANNMANMKMNAQQLSQMMNNMQISKEQLEAMQQLGQMLKMSEMNIGQADQPCELCDGSGKG